MMVGDAPPQPAKDIATLLARLAGPARLVIGGIQPPCRPLDRVLAARETQIGIERSCKGQSLDDGGIVALGDVAHQGAHAPGMLGKAAQVVARTRAFHRFQRKRAEAGIDEIIVELAVVLQIDFAAPLGDFVERRLRDVEMAAFDDFRHLPVEEGQEKRADMSAVDVGVRHDDDLVVTKLLDVEIVAADAGAHRLDQSPDFLGRQHPVEARALDVEDLALQGEDRLGVAVAALLGRAAGGITLDQEELGFGRILFLAIGKLAGKRGHAEHALAAGFARLAGGLARRGGIDDLLDDGAGMGRIFLQPFRHLVRHQAFQRLTHL